MCPRRRPTRSRVPGSSARRIRSSPRRRCLRIRRRPAHEPPRSTSRGPDVARVGWVALPAPTPELRQAGTDRARVCSTSSPIAADELLESSRSGAVRGASSRSRPRAAGRRDRRRSRAGAPRPGARRRRTADSFRSRSPRDGRASSPRRRRRAGRAGRAGRRGSPSGSRARGRGGRRGRRSPRPRVAGRAARAARSGSPA